jgi:hypothetical protein
MAASRRTVIGVGVAILGLMLFFALLVLGPKDQSFATTTTNTFDALAASSQPSALLLEASGEVPVRASMDNDLDNDGKVDGVADESLALSVVVIFFAFSVGALLIPPLGVTSTLLVVYYKALKLASAYYPPLERPG